MKCRVVGVRSIALVLAVSAIGGCGGVFESEIPAAQAFVLRYPQRPANAPGTAPRGSVLVQRPEAGPGLDSDRIALLRSDNRFDFYAASRWAAPAPDMVESVIVEPFKAFAKPTVLTRPATRVTWACSAGESVLNRSVPFARLIASRNESVLSSMSVAWSATVLTTMLANRRAS